jgi:hypothetical protein
VLVERVAWISVGGVRTELIVFIYRLLLTDLETLGVLGFKVVGCGG